MTTPITEINEDNVLTLLREVVDEVGEDYVYPEELKSDEGGFPSCIYVSDALKPLCIVGRVVAKTTADLSGFLAEDHSRMGNSTVNTRIFDEVVVAALSGVTVTAGARYVLGEAQFVQDSRKTFGEAYGVAEQARG